MEQTSQNGLVKAFLVMASLVVLIAGVKAATAIFVPLLLSIFIAVICVPPTSYLERKGVPDPLAIFIVLVAVLLVGSLLVSYVGSSLTSFTKSLPAYEEKWSAQLGAIISRLNEFGIEVSLGVFTEYFDPSIAMKMVANVFSSLSDILANLFLIILTVVFILLEAASFPRKMKSAFGGSDAGKAMAKFETIAAGINKYLAIKSVVSLATGFIITTWLFILGVDYPLLWGLLAFMLNYVPNIGSIIAAVPAVLVAMVQLNFGITILVAAGYVVVNIVMGNMIEPRLMGRGVGLSTLVVFLSLVFWGWVLGPVGMLLSVPLTMVVKIALESNKETEWLAILLGSETKQAIAPEKLEPATATNENA